MHSSLEAPGRAREPATGGVKAEEAQVGAAADAPLRAEAWARVETRRRDHARALRSRARRSAHARWRGPPRGSPEPRPRLAARNADRNRDERPRALDRRSVGIPAWRPFDDSVQELDPENRGDVPERGAIAGAPLDLDQAPGGLRLGIGADRQRREEGDRKGPADSGTTHTTPRARLTGLGGSSAHCPSILRIPAACRPCGYLPR